MKNFQTLAETRRACHTFEPNFKLSEAQFQTILEAVRYTPSGYNAQPWSFALVQSVEKIQQLYELSYKQKHVLEAGNVVIVLGNKEFGVQEADRIVKEWELLRNFDKKQSDALYASLTKNREDWKKREMMLRNCSLAAMTFMYAAADLGLATCPMMGFRQLDLKRWLDLPDELIPVMMIAIGKGKETSEQLPRKTSEDLIWRIL